HQDEVGLLGFGAGDPGLAVGGLQDRIARACQQVAQNPAQVFLVFDDKNAFAHGTLLRNSARMGSSIAKLEPLPSVDATLDAPTVHLHDLFGDGKSKPRPALDLGVGTVGLMKLIEDAGEVGFGDAGLLALDPTRYNAPAFSTKTNARRSHTH